MAAETDGGPAHRPATRSARRAAGTTRAGTSRAGARAAGATGGVASQAADADARRTERVRRRRRSVAAGAALAVASTGIVAAALAYDGEPVADIELHDGGVWVTNSDELLVGRVNYPVQELDGSVTAASADVDVLQEGSTVLVVDHGAALLQTLDPATVSTGTGAVTLPRGAELGLGGDTVGMLEPGSGALRSVPVDQVGLLGDAEAAPNAHVGADGQLAVGRDGAVHGMSVTDGTVVTIPAGTEPAGGGPAPAESGSDAPSDEPGPPEAEEGEEETTEALPTVDLGVGPDRLAEAEHVALTAVGEEPMGAVVTEDHAQLLVLRPDREPLDLTSYDLDLTEVALQQPSAATGQVALATRDALVLLPVDGDEPTIIRSEMAGVPAEPIAVGDCVHGAWAGAEGSYLVRCGDAEAVDAQVPLQGSDNELRLRTNHDLVVLNDTLTGTVYLPQEDMMMVDNWDDTTPPEGESEEETESTDDRLEDQPLDREEENRPPRAVDDALGVRPGSVTVLEVLANDTDPDGDLLTVTDFGDVPEETGVLSSIMGGRALQIAVPETATGQVSVPYTITDGRENGEAEGTITLRVVPDTENSAPQVREDRDPRMDLALGGTGEIDVLASMIDPEGDEMLLARAETDSDDVVHFTPDGRLTFVDTGTSSGVKEVTVAVSDGTDVTEVIVPVEVHDAENLPPRAVNDYVSLSVGEETVVEVLANDVDPEGEPLRLGSVTPAEVADVRPDYDTGQVHLTGLSEGTNYLEYVVADSGGQDTTGLVRVDVVAPDTEAPPVAVRDTALLPAGGSVLVDVLANDEDPAGGLLAVQQIEVPQDSPLVVAVLEHRMLRISAAQTLTGPQRLTYTVSNGTATATGEVVVLPIMSDVAPQPPVAEPDVVDVRAGDYVTIPVLQNDSHPQGLEYTLDAELSEEPESSRGHFFTSDQVVRFRAPETPQTVNAVYSVTDENGNSASALITVRVQAASDANSAPLPEPVETRAFGGERVRIQVPMYGIDPDGDSVQLLGAGTAPQLGRIVEVGSGYLDYEAYGQSSGTDTFTYTVRDRLGAVGSAQVRVAVVPPPMSNSRPQAQDDSVQVRPGRTVDVDVLSNDTDPDGDPLYLADDPDGGPFDDVPELSPQATEQQRVRVSTPADPATFSLIYRVSDRRGGLDSGVATIDVTPDAPLLPPLARDDLVAPADIIGHDIVTVPVLANDEDPDGTADALTVSLVDPPEGARVAGNDVQVPVLPTRQVVTYRVTDPDGLEGYAFIDVPGSEDTGPVLRTNVDPIEVHSGERIEIDLEHYVVAPSGRDIRLTDETQVTATSSDGSSPVVDATTLQFTSAPDYYGPASITFEVTDGETAQDGLSSRLTLPITVVPDGVNIPPTFRGGEIEVVPGEDPESVNLRSAIDDPEDFSALRLEVVEDGVPDGLTATVEGHTLTVEADVDVVPGQTLDLPMTVSDPVNDPVPGVVRVEVTASNRDMPSVPDVDLGEVEQGETEVVDILQGAFNPYAEDGEPLTVVSAAAEQGVARVEHSLTDVSVTPGEDFVGPLTVRVTVEDATGLPTRQAEARISMNVVGVPGTPAPPRVQESQDGAVVLTWAAPVANGSPITGYTVDTAGQRQECATTTCTVSGLTNGQEYTFTVIATNAVGDSEPSAPSGPAIPDVRPERPAAPSAERGDGQVQLSWETPVSRGTPVERYDVQVTPSTGGGQVSATSTSHTWSGLSNGTSYTFRVRAHNGADEPSEWSPWSQAVVPAGPPSAPGTPQVQRVDSPVAAQITGSFGAADANGSPITGYEVVIYQDGAEFSRFTTQDTSFTQDAPEGHDYSVAVAATNDVDQGPASPRSGTVRSFIQPTAPGTPTVTATGSDGQVTLDYGAADPRGDEISRYEYSMNGGGWETLSGDSVSGLTNGSSYTFRVRACNTYCGDPSGASSSAVPFGPMADPTIRASASTPSQYGTPATVDVSWSVPDGNGRPIVEAYVEITGQSRIDARQRTSITINPADWSTDYRATITVVRDDGSRTTREATANARTGAEPDRPTRTVTIVRDRDARGEPGTPPCLPDNNDCAFLDFTFDGFEHWGDEAPYTVTWYDDDGSYGPIRPTDGWPNPSQWTPSGDSGRENSQRYQGNPVTLTLEIENASGAVVARDTHRVVP
ncbi:Ig-like domain-containing protein [Georgenia sp. Z1491]|uniref:Ig-like domain-containing protein n=1 Tax=Georgenia sp. Z1491 TaxID=3416707 RepID=UPI003CF3A859